MRESITKVNFGKGEIRQGLVGKKHFPFIDTDMGRRGHYFRGYSVDSGTELTGAGIVLLEGGHECKWV